LLSVVGGLSIYFADCDCKCASGQAALSPLPSAPSPSLGWHIMYVANKGSRASRRRRRRRRWRSGRRKSFVFRNSEGVDARGRGRGAWEGLQGGGGRWRDSRQKAKGEAK